MPYFNIKKPKKEVSINKRKDDIVNVATRVKHQVSNAKITSILNCRSDVKKIYDKINNIYEFVIKIA